MASLDSVSIAVFLGAILVMAGILSSLLALRFGAPLLLVFLLIGMLAGDSGPGRLQFDDVRSTYLVGSVALALILFDGGLKTRFQSIRTVLAPSMVLATAGVLLTALITAPVAKYVLDLNWTEASLVGAVVASTDAAAAELPARWLLGVVLQPGRSTGRHRTAPPSTRTSRLGRVASHARRRWFV